MCPQKLKHEKTPPSCKEKSIKKSKCAFPCTNACLNFDFKKKLINRKQNQTILTQSNHGDLVKKIDMK